MLSIFLVGDQSYIRQGLKMQLDLKNDIEVIGEASNEHSAVTGRYFRYMAEFVSYTAQDVSTIHPRAYTPPGGGVHGMCGYSAAQAVLHSLS
jgi:hypothetical protein